MNTPKATAALSIVAIAAVHGLVHAFSIFLSPLNEEIRQYFLADAVSAVTAFKSTYLATYAASNLLFGLLTNRISARRTLAIGLAVNGLAVAAFALVPPDGIGWMHALWLLAALGGGVYHPVANVLITRLYPQGKGRVIGYTGMGAALGFALSPLMTMGLTSLFDFGWQEVAFTFGLFGVAVSLWVYATVQDVAPLSTVGGPVSERTQTGVAGERPAPTGDAPGDAGESGRTTTGARRPASAGSGAFAGILGVLIAVILISGAREMAMWSVLDISDFFLLRVLGETGHTGVFLFLLYAPGIIIQPLAGSLSDALGRRWLATASFIVYGASVGLAGVLPPEAVFLAYLGMGVGQAATIPTVEAFVADVAGPQLRGAAYGAFFTAGIALGSLGPGGTGAMVDLMGGGLPAFRLVLGVLGGLVLIAACFAPFVMRERVPATQA